MKKQLTPEQEAARDARREQFKQLWKRVAAMDAAQREIQCASLGYVNTEGKPFSACNSMLLAFQGGGTVFGGFRQWLAMGRAVRKGQHGRMIWVPIGGRKATNTTEAEEGSETHFITGTVFDISQTDEIAVQAAA